MRTLRNIIPLILPVFIMAFSSCSVNDNTYDGEVTATLYDIVTFTGNDNGQAVFTFNQVDDSPEVTLRANGTLDDKRIEPGKRIYIAYQPVHGKAYVSDDIRLYSLASINNGTINTEESIADFPEWDRDKVYLLAAWRSGKYINLQTRLVYTKEPRKYRLVGDPETFGDHYPDVYLLHQLNEETDNFQRTFYASFDISPIWELPTCRGITLHISNSNLKQTIFTFNK